MPVKFIKLVRHGESEANENKEVLLEKADHDINLSEKGRAQAKECGQFLREWCHNRIVSTDGTVGPKIRLWHSPYLRAIQTADLIREEMGPQILDVREHFLLGEQQFGLFDGIHDHEIGNHFPVEDAYYKKHMRSRTKFWAKMPLGESRFDVTQRVHQSFGTFQRDAEQNGIEHLVIVAHGIVIRAFVMAWCRKTIDWFEKEKNPTNCSVRLIEGTEDRGYIR